MVARRRDDTHANLTAGWTLFCLFLIAALAITVGVLMEAY